MKKTALLIAALMLMAALTFGAAALAGGSHLPYTPETMPAPEICSLKMLDEQLEENPIIEFSLKIPAQLEEDIAAIEEAGGSVTIRTEVRIRGEEEWGVLWTSQNGAHAGDIRGFVVSIAEDGEIIPRSTMLELRCCYCVEQYDPETNEYIEEFDSAYSGIYLVNEDTGVTPAASTAEPQPTDAPEPAAPAKKAGKLLPYLAIAVAEAALVAAIILIVKKKKN